MARARRPVEPEVDAAAEEARELAAFNAYAADVNRRVALGEAGQLLHLAHWSSRPRRGADINSANDDPGTLRRLAEEAPPSGYRDQALEALDRADKARLLAEEKAALADG